MLPPPPQAFYTCFTPETFRVIDQLFDRIKTEWIIMSDGSAPPRIEEVGTWVGTHRRKSYLGNCGFIFGLWEEVETCLPSVMAKFNPTLSDSINFIRHFELLLCAWGHLADCSVKTVLHLLILSANSQLTRVSADVTSILHLWLCKA